MAARKKGSESLLKSLIRLKAKLDKNSLTPIIFAAMGLFVALFVNLLSNRLDLMLGPWSIVIPTIIIFILLYIVASIILRTPDGQLPEDLASDQFAARCINTPAVIAEANRITHRAFGESTVPDDRVEKILLKNKFACLGLFEKDTFDDETLVGYASCWPISREVYERLRLGEDDPNGLSEKDFGPEHILKDSQIDETEVLFIPGVAVLEPDSYRGKFRAAVLACEWVHHIKKTFAGVVTKRELWIFIVGFTKQGQAMTKRMAAHLGLDQPSGYLKLYGERVPFFEQRIRPEDWENTIDRVEGRLFRAMYKGGGGQAL
jgi:hypothetical protein